MWGYWGFYSSKRLASLPWYRSLFLMGIPLNSPKRDGQDFFLKRRSSLTCVSSGILFVLGFLFSLGFYDDSGVCSKYFQSRVSAVPWAYPLSAHGLGSVRPNLTKVRHAIFLLLQLPLHPMGSSCLSGWTNGVTVQYSGGWRISKRTTRTTPIPDKLWSNYDARHVLLFDWFFPLIDASLRLPCTSYIYITLLLSYFSIFNWNILSKRYRQPCQRAIRSIAVPVINTTIVLHLFTDLVSILFS